MNAGLAGREAASRSNGLKIKAVSWNGGNFQAQRETLQKIAEVPETWDADLVMFGLQEIPTNMTAMKELGKGSLWRNQEGLEQLRAKIKEAIQIPPHVKSSKEKAVDALRKFTSGLGAKMQQTFREHVERAGFYNDLLAETATSSAATKLSLEAEDIKSTLNGVASQITVAHRHDKFQALEKLKAALKTLTSQAEYPPQELEEALGPVHTWANEAQSTIAQHLDRHPHVMWSNTAASKFRNLLKDLQSTHGIQEKLGRANAEGTKEFLQGSEDLERELAQQVSGMDDARAQRLLKDVGDVLRATKQLDNDVEAISDKEMAPKIKANIEMAISGLAKMHSSIKTWTQQLEAQLEELMQSPEFEISSEELEAPFFFERFEANGLCTTVSHYDTALFLYVNPMSEWTITVDRHQGGSCKRSSSNGWGCTINNNKWSLTSFKMECGKVVNFVKLHASKGDTSMSICALNTHMSFDAGVDARSADISAALRETDEAGCDSVVFVGDFNSRLHCEPTTKPDFSPFPTEGAPFYARPIPDMLKNCVNGGIVSLQSPCKSYDELALVLDNSEVMCYESKKKAWKRAFLRTGMDSYGFREASDPNFIATYKVAHGAASVEDEMGMSKHNCLNVGNTPVCYVDNVEKPKNKPAWPDRILVKANPRKAFLRTESYDVVLGIDVPSDHLPVAALLSLDPSFEI